MKPLASLAALFVALVLPQAVLAVSSEGAARGVPYVIGFAPLRSMQQPFVGQMVLDFSKGIISGRYTDISIRPGSPFANRRNVPVRGGSSNGNLTLDIGGVTFRGTIRDGWMRGSATIRGRIYEFDAERGRPGSG
jgi:hypothetical protein